MNSSNSEKEYMKVCEDFAKELAEAINKRSLDLFVGKYCTLGYQADTWKLLLFFITVGFMQILKATGNDAESTKYHIGEAIRRAFDMTDEQLEKYVDVHHQGLNS